MCDDEGGDVEDERECQSDVSGRWIEKECAILYGRWYGSEYGDECMYDKYDFGYWT